MSEILKKKKKKLELHYLTFWAVQRHDGTNICSCVPYSCPCRNQAAQWDDTCPTVFCMFCSPRPCSTEGSCRSNLFSSLPVFQSRLMEDLVSSKAQLSQLRLEALTQKEKAAELETKLTSVLGSSESESQKTAGLETQLKGLFNSLRLKISNHSNEITVCNC